LGEASVEAVGGGVAGGRKRPGEALVDLRALVLSFRGSR
jgi:hypothetical protein